MSTGRTPGNSQTPKMPKRFLQITFCIAVVVAALVGIAWLSDMQRRAEAERMRAENARLKLGAEAMERSRNFQH